MSAVPVKEERQDEAEIRELALKIAEAQRQRMLAPPRNANPMTNSTAPGMTILNYFSRKTKEGDTPPQGTPAEPQNPAGRMDEESFRGRFGWFTLGKNHIPFILRTSERYVSVRMLELKVLQKYLTFLHQDVYNCTSIRSFYITDLEARVLNEINIRHCDYQFGKEQYTVRDLIVRLTDSVEFYNFLEVCYNKLVNGSNNPIGRCGFIRINKESVVPYTVYNLEKYVPLFYFEGETENLKTKADQLEGWDLAYLKFCCKVQGIRNELFASDSCAVISLHDIKNYFPPGTLFEDYWPSKVVDNHLLINRKNLPPAGQWTRQPQFVPTRPPPSPKPTVPTKPPMNHHPNVQTLNYTNYGIAGTQPVHPNLQSRTATSTMRPTYTSTAAATRNHSRGPPYYNLNQTQGPPPPLIRPLQQYVLQF